MIPERIRDTGKKNYSTRTTQGNKKQKEKVQHWSRVSSGESRKSSKNKEIGGPKFGMQMIADRFGDGWYKSITDICGGQQIKELFGDGVT